jgi:Protein of unknown function (DUF1552)
MYAIRDVEKRIHRVETSPGGLAAAAPVLATPPSNIPEDLTEHAHLMFDLMTMAFQTDSTRIVSFMLAVEQSNRAYREIGIPEAHHGLTHHGGDKEKIEKCIRINRFQVGQFAYVLGKLKSTPDGDGTLLDHVAITYGSGLSTNHNHEDLPTVLAGRGHGAMHPGRHIKYPLETPLANLHQSMVATLGLAPVGFADGTGRLEDL